MRKTHHYLNFAIPGIVKGEATGLYGILAFCFLAALLGGVIIAIWK
jgi:hypothetical protein